MSVLNREVDRRINSFGFSLSILPHNSGLAGMEEQRAWNWSASHVVGNCVENVPVRGVLRGFFQRGKRAWFAAGDTQRLFHRDADGNCLPCPRSDDRQRLQVVYSYR